MSDMRRVASTIAAVGVTASAQTTASAAAALPNTSAGVKPTVVEVVAVACGYIKFGGASVAATANDIMVTTTPRRFYLGPGMTHFSVIREAADTKINIVAVE